MSSLDELVAARRSIRKYKADMPPAAWIEGMLQIASQAPSPANRQPVRFIRINSSGVLKELHDALDAGRQRFLQAASASQGSQQLRNLINAYYRFSEFMFRAPILMAVGTVDVAAGFSRKLSESGIIVPVGRTGTDTDMTVGLALQGFMLKGQEFGLGTCILTAPLVFISSASCVEEIVGIKDVKIKCFLTVGFPDEAPPSPKKKGIPDIYREI